MYVINSTFSALFLLGNCCYWQTCALMRTIIPEAIVQRCSVKKVFLEISENSQENTCTRVSFLIKLRPATCFKKRLWHRCFLVNFVKFLRTPLVATSVMCTLFLLNVVLIHNESTSTEISLRYCMKNKRQFDTAWQTRSNKLINNKVLQILLSICEAPGLPGTEEKRWYLLRGLFCIILKGVVICHFGGKLPPKLFNYHKKLT